MMLARLPAGVFAHGVRPPTGGRYYEYCEPFETQVFDDVLPSIRQTGSYRVTTQALPDFTIPAKALR